MKFCRAAAILMLLATATPAGSTVAAEPDATRELRSSAVSVSIVQLLANPKAFNGRLVRVHGYVNLEFEGSAVYLHKEDFEQGIRENGIWLNGASCINQEGKKLTSGYAHLIGTFDASDHGHLGMWSGAITSKLCEAWPARRGKVGVVSGPNHSLERPG